MELKNTRTLYIMLTFFHKNKDKPRKPAGKTPLCAKTFANIANGMQNSK